MKKSIVLLVAVVALIVLATGCGKKETLVCTQSIRGGILTFNVDFDGSVITAMDFDYEMDLSSYSDIYANAYANSDWCSSFKKALPDYKDAFVDCKSEMKDKKLKVSSKLEVSKLAKNLRSRIKTASSAKKDMEAAGYQCTIK